MTTWQKPRGWAQRYAGYEPELHSVDLYPRKGMSLKNLIDSVAEDVRLPNRQPLRPVKRANGVEA